jgi:hypothetical protein
MISMELQPSVHMQHLNHGGHQQVHGDLNVYQHQMTNITTTNGDDKSKSKLRTFEI